jgi:hypothetical protein
MCEIMLMREEPFPIARCPFLKVVWENSRLIMENGTKIGRE